MALVAFAVAVLVLDFGERLRLDRVLSGGGFSGALAAVRGRPAVLLVLLVGFGRNIHFEAPHQFIHLAVQVVDALGGLVGGPLHLVEGVGELLTVRMLLGPRVINVCKDLGLGFVPETEHNTRQVHHSLGSHRSAFIAPQPAILESVGGARELVVREHLGVQEHLWWWHELVVVGIGEKQPPSPREDEVVHHEVCLIRPAEPGLQGVLLVPAEVSRLVVLVASQVHHELARGSGGKDVAHVEQGRVGMAPKDLEHVDPLLVDHTSFALLAHSTLVGTENHGEQDVGHHDHDEEDDDPEEKFLGTGAIIHSEAIELPAVLLVHPPVKLKEPKGHE
mmetsp:Transcript_29995/g.87347  ORF Transcript_29995/g.87347 Transcript_29995/m.87347 type:complete len:334 (-) Transcript_29995:791-1792(-)